MDKLDELILNLNQRNDSRPIPELIVEAFEHSLVHRGIDDVRPIIDAARPEIQRVFSQKPRRLSSGGKPRLNSPSE